MATFINISTNQIDSYILVVGEANARQLEWIPLEGWGARMRNQKLRNIRPSGAF